MPTQLLDSLKQEFLEGVNGDVTLKFVHDGKVVESRKCHSLLINKFEYFAAQSNFAEGSSKEFKIDIESFYEGCQVGFKQFVEATFVGLFGGDADDLKLDLWSKYSVIRFREYLGFDYDDLCEDSVEWSEPMTPDEVKEAGKAMVLLLRRCSEEVAVKVVESDAHKLVVEGDSFAARWYQVYSMVKEFSEDGRLTPIGKILCKFLCARYRENYSSFFSECDGFGDGLVKCVSMHYEAGVSIVQDREIEKGLSEVNCKFVMDMWSRLEESHLTSWQDLLETAYESEESPELPPNEFIESFKCDSETTIFDLQAMVFLLSLVLRPTVTEIFHNKVMDEPEKPPAPPEGTVRNRSELLELQQQMRTKQYKHNGFVWDLFCKADDLISEKLHEVHKELASRVMKLTDLNANLTKRLEKSEAAKEEGTATGSKRRREE